MSDTSLIVQINDFVNQGNFKLPVFDDIALRIMKMARHEDFDIREMSRMIYQDQVLVAEVLKAANSPFFGGLSAITTIKDAIVRLGARQVADLVLMASERTKYTAKDPRFKKMLNSLWKHAVACAMGSQWLARKLNYHEKDNEAFIGGLLHDIGKLFLLRVLDAMQEAGNTPFTISFDLSSELINSFHSEQGFELLKKWNLPPIYCEIARDHHKEEFDQFNIPLVLIRLTNQACNKLGIGTESDPSIELMSAPEAISLQVKEIALAELEIMLEDTMNISG